MPNDPLASPLAALRRKLRALASVARDAGATPPERANAAALKSRLEQRLRDAGAPAGDWTDQVFRLGRWTRGVGKPSPSAAGDSDWTEQARSLGKMVGRGYKKWLSH